MPTITSGVSCSIWGRVSSPVSTYVWADMLTMFDNTWNVEYNTQYHDQRIWLNENSSPRALSNKVKAVLVASFLLLVLVPDFSDCCPLHSKHCQTLPPCLLMRMGGFPMTNGPRGQGRSGVVLSTSVWISPIVWPATQMFHYSNHLQMS